MSAACGQGLGGLNELSIEEFSRMMNVLYLGRSSYDTYAARHI